MPLLIKKKKKEKSSLVKSLWFGGIGTCGIAKAFPFMQLSVKCSTYSLFQTTTKTLAMLKCISTSVIACWFSGRQC